MHVWSPLSCIGEKILSVPVKYVISKFSVAGTPLESLLRQLDGVLPEKAVSALVLLHYYDGEGSVAKSVEDHGWQSDYLASLPTSLTNLLYFTSDDLEELQCPVGELNDSVCHAYGTVELLQSVCDCLYVRSPRNAPSSSEWKRSATSAGSVWLLLGTPSIFLLMCGCSM